nr:transmembrane protein 104-like isoform X6 [Pelodiscus sinensis]|eukprot:XP_025041207.1 transmembrane protein 104-like isoform X6 [Pelodiscus sinensis]
MMGEESQYSLMVGMMYVFNSMFGIGILALPKAFADAGWLASSVILVLAMVMSYITVTFLIEVMSSANARVVWNRNNDIHKENEMILKENVPLSGKREEESTHTKALHSESFSKYICCYYCLPDDRKPSVFDINEFLSLTDLTKMYFSTVGDLLSRITLILGIYGSLAMFLTMVPFSLSELFCNIPSCTGVNNFTAKPYEENHCWGPISRINAYRIFLAGFVLLIGPFVFFSIQKNKFIQIFATIVSFSAGPAASLACSPPSTPCIHLRGIHRQKCGSLSCGSRWPACSLSPRDSRKSTRSRLPTRRSAGPTGRSSGLTGSKGGLPGPSWCGNMMPCSPPFPQ